MLRERAWVVKEVPHCDRDIPNVVASLSPIVRDLLLQRGVMNGEECERFLYPKLSDLSDPYLMPEMRQAVDRIFRAIDGGETICIYGDYDVDGVTSVAFLRQLLQAYDATPKYFIPVRSKEGYGLSVAGLARCMEECGGFPNLLITVDCGTSSVEEVQYLCQHGVDVVILDHHEMGTQGRPPAVALVNAKAQEGCPYTYLCSAGVVFKLAHALIKERKLDYFDLRQYLDMVTLATISDIVPLVEENRMLVRHGLRRLAATTHAGIQKLNVVAGIDFCEDSSLNSSQVGFRLGPRINAAGRMDRPEDALELLLTVCPEQAAVLAQRLDEHNKKRQEEEESIRLEAIEMLKQTFDEDADHVIVLGSRAWHPGVVGIVASQIMRRHHRPTFVISIDEHGLGKGSGRSIPGVSLVDAIHHCSDMLVSGGGHDMAAGLVIEEHKIDSFRMAFNNYVLANTTPEQRMPTLNIDAVVELKDLTLELLDDYQLLEPFGNTNPLPVFMACGVTCTERRIVGTNHLKLVLQQDSILRDAIFFNAANATLPVGSWDVAFTIDKNVFRGRVSLSICVLMVRASLATRAFSD